jgi:hypothetical protein
MRWRAAAHALRQAPGMACSSRSSPVHSHAPRATGVCVCVGGGQPSKQNGGRRRVPACFACFFLGVLFFREERRKREAPLKHSHKGAKPAPPPGTRSKTQGQERHPIGWSSP